MTRSFSAPFGAGRNAALDGRYAAPHWYACTTRARHEKTVNALLERGGIESYLPLAERESQWKDRRKRVAFALFPGYVFARFTLDAVFQVLNTHGLASVVGVRGTPAPIADDEMTNVRRFAECVARSGAAVEEAVELVPGTWVRVATGPFVGVEGIVTGAGAARRVRVGLQLIGRFMEVDLGAASVEPIPTPARLPAAAAA